MITQVKLAVLFSSLAASTALFAQSTAPAQKQNAQADVKPTQVAQSQQQQDRNGSPGAQAAGAAAGQTASSSTPAWVVPAAIAAGLVAVGVVVANQDDDNPSTTQHGR